MRVGGKGSLHAKMEDVEIKEESALNWWQIYEDSLGGKFSYVKEKDESGQERVYYIANARDYAKLWFQDESFRIRKLESFKTKEEYEMDVGVLTRKDIVKRFEMGVYDSYRARAPISLQFDDLGVSHYEDLNPVEFGHKYEIVKAFQSGTLETKFIKQRVLFNKREIRMYDRKFNIGFVCSGGKYFEESIPDIETFASNNGILREEAISYVSTLKGKKPGPVGEYIDRYLDDVIENIRTAPRIIYYLADSKFEDQLRGKQVDFFVLKYNRKPSDQDMNTFPNAEKYLFDFDEDRISSISLREAQKKAGGELFLKFYSREQKRDVDDILPKELVDVIKKKTGYDFNLLKLECIANQLYVLEFLSLAREFQKKASGGTFSLQSKKGELATAFGLFTLEDHKPIHGETVHMNEGIVEVKDKTDFCEGNLAYHLRAPLVFQRTKHATLTFVLPTYKPEIKVCLILSKEDTFLDDTTVTYRVENTRFAHAEALNDEMRKSIGNLAGVKRVTCVKNKEEKTLMLRITSATLEDEKEKETSFNFKAQTKTFVPKSASESSIQFYHSILEPVKKMDQDIPFLNGVFCETCIEALPAPFWHRSRPKTFWEKCSTLVSSVKGVLTPKREIEDRDASLRDVYALVVPESGKLGPKKLVFRCFGIEHETDQIVSKDRLELHYEKKGSGEFTHTVSRIFVITQDSKTNTVVRRGIARCDTSKKYNGHIGWDICDAALDVEDGYRKTDTYLRIFSWACERFANAKVIPYYSKKTFEDLVRYMITLAKLFKMDNYSKAAEKFLNIQQSAFVNTSLDKDFEKNLNIISMMMYRCKAETIFYKKNILGIANEMRESCYKKLDELVENPGLLGTMNIEKLRKKDPRVFWGVVFAFHLATIFPGFSASSLKKMYDVVLVDIHKAENMVEKTTERYKNFLTHYNVSNPPEKPIVRFQAMALLHKLCGV